MKQPFLSRQPGSMGTKGYAIKLYGHGSSDPKQFCQGLAVILGIPVEQAEKLLNQAPVILKQGMRKTEAHELHRLLQSIAAWCIIEVPDGESPVDGVTEKPIRLAIAEDLLEQDVSNEGHPRLWLGIMLGLTVFLVMFVLVGFLSYMGSMRDIVGTKKPVAVPSDEPQISKSEPEESESPDIIRARIEQLESSLRSLYARRTEIQESRDLPNAVYLEREIGNQIRAEYRELRTLQVRLQLMESD